MMYNLMKKPWHLGHTQHSLFVYGGSSTLSWAGRSGHLCVALKQLATCTCRAPEQIDTEFGPTGSHTDVWDFAMTVLHLATGGLPHANLSDIQVVSAMLTGRHWNPAVSAALPNWLQQLLRQCLSKDSHERPSIPHLLQVSHRGLIVGPSNNRQLFATAYTSHAHALSSCLRHHS